MTNINIANIITDTNNTYATATTIAYDYNYATPAAINEQIIAINPEQDYNNR